MARVDVLVHGVGDDPRRGPRLKVPIHGSVAMPSPLVVVEEAGLSFPTPATTGLPDGWEPAVTTATLVANVNGATYENYLITGSVEVRAADVTFRNCKMTGSYFWNQWSGVQYGPFVVEYCDLGPDSGMSPWLHGAIGVSKYEARYNYIHNFTDAFRASALVGGEDTNIWAYRNCAILGDNPGEHADGFQCFGGGREVLIEENTIMCILPSARNAAVFAADSSYEMTVVNNLLGGGAYTIRLHQWEVPSTFVVTGNRVVDESWTYDAAYATRNPGDGSNLDLTWSDNRLVTIDANYQILTEGALIPAP